MEQAFKLTNPSYLVGKGQGIKILLINPKSLAMDAISVPPLGILYIAAWLEREEFDRIEVIDDLLMNYQDKYLHWRIKSSDIVGITGTTSQYPWAMRLARMCAKEKKFCVYGGPHATPQAQECLQQAPFDAICLREGEETFCELVSTLIKGGSLEKVKGITYRTDNGSICDNPGRPYINSIDRIPFPARHLVPVELYASHQMKPYKGPFTSVFCDRGCPQKCVFCESPLMWGGKVRIRSMENFFEELLEIYHTYGITNIHIHDDTFTVNKKRVHKFCEIVIESGIPFKWTCITRADCVDLELLRHMKQAGCLQVEFGVESGDANIIRITKKNYNHQKLKESFLMARKEGLLTRGYFIVGLPGETVWTWLKTIWFALSLRSTAGNQWTVNAPYPGTEQYTQNMVEITDSDYSHRRHKQPVIRSGKLGPRSLRFMRFLSNLIANN